MKEIIISTTTCSGGVGRNVLLLSNCFLKNGYKVCVVSVQDAREDLKNFLSCVSPEVDLVFLNEIKLKKKVFIPNVIKCIAKTRLKIDRIFNKRPNDNTLINKRYGEVLYNEIYKLKFILEKYKNADIISLDDHSNHMVCLYKKVVKFKNKIIISERGAPSINSEGSRTPMAFIRKLYPLADYMVCQSYGAKDWYDNHTTVTTKVIFNAIKPDLPERFIGTRKKKIVNFCSIAAQKNLILLLEAFSLFNKDYPEYDLEIIGNPQGGQENYKTVVIDKIKELALESKVHIYPDRIDVHSTVKDYAMFVSSSDWEGLSNSMLEAMAIGLPCICTDCPEGGARAVIRDHHNGILTPVRNAEALYIAMKEVIENPELSEKLSKNGSMIKEELALDVISKKWFDLIEG